MQTRPINSNKEMKPADAKDDLLSRNVDENNDIDTDEETIDLEDVVGGLTSLGNEQKPSASNDLSSSLSERAVSAEQLSLANNLLNLAKTTKRKQQEDTADTQKKRIKQNVIQLEAKEKALIDEIKAKRQELKKTKEELAKAKKKHGSSSFSSAPSSSSSPSFSSAPSSSSSSFSSAPSSSSSPSFSSAPSSSSSSFSSAPSSFSSSSFSSAPSSSSSPSFSSASSSSSSLPFYGAPLFYGVPSLYGAPPFYGMPSFYSAPFSSSSSSSSSFSSAPPFYGMPSFYSAPSSFYGAPSLSSAPSFSNTPFSSSSSSSFSSALSFSRASSSSSSSSSSNKLTIEPYMLKKDKRIQAPILRTFLPPSLAHSPLGKQIMEFFNALTIHSALHRKMWKDAKDSEWGKYLLGTEVPLEVVFFFLKAGHAARNSGFVQALWDAHSSKILGYFATLRETFESDKLEIAKIFLECSRMNIFVRDIWTSSLQDVFVREFFKNKKLDQRIKNFYDILLHGRNFPPATWKFTGVSMVWETYIKDIVKGYFNDQQVATKDKIKFFNAMFFHAPNDVVSVYADNLKVNEQTDGVLLHALQEEIGKIGESKQWAFKNGDRKLLTFLANAMKARYDVLESQTASSIASSITSSSSSSVAPSSSSSSSFSSVPFSSSVSSMTSSSASAGSSSSSSFSSSSSSSSVSYSPSFFQQQNTPSSSSSSSLTSTDDDVSRSSQLSSTPS